MSQIKLVLDAMDKYRDVPSAMASSADLCERDCLTAIDMMEAHRAYYWGMASLRYRIGVLHPAYQELVRTGSGI